MNAKDLSGAPTGTLLMTGGSRGLGRKAAAHLLREHPEHHLLLTVRKGAGRKLATELTAETGNPHVSTLDCDLASLADVRTAAMEVGRRLDSAELPPLTTFLANAGVQQASRVAPQQKGSRSPSG